MEHNHRELALRDAAECDSENPRSLMELAREISHESRELGTKKKFCRLCAHFNGKCILLLLSVPNLFISLCIFCTIAKAVGVLSFRLNQRRMARCPVKYSLLLCLVCGVCVFVCISYYNLLELETTTKKKTGHHECNNK